jgi:hypothetical protein
LVRELLEVLVRDLEQGIDGLGVGDTGTKIRQRSSEVAHVLFFLRNVRDCIRERLARGSGAGLRIDALR